jgi:hypothetical protein
VLLASTAAVAGTIVMSGDLPDARARASAEDASFAGAALVSWEEVRDRDARFVEGGDIVLCTGAVMALSAWRTAVDGAVGRVAYGEWDAAIDETVAARSALPCLEEPPTRADLLAVFTASGIANWETGNEEAARQDFQTAIAWQDGAPPASLPLAERAAWEALPVPQSAVRLRVVGPSNVLVDGATLGTAVTPGWHHVAAGDLRAWVRMAPGSRSTLVVPSSLPADALERLDEGALRADVSSALAAAFGEGSAIAVVHSRGTWFGAAGRTDWRHVPVVAAAPEPERKGTRVGRALFLGGGAIGVAGGAVTGATWLAAQGARKDYRSSDTGDQAVASRERFYGAVDTYAVARWFGIGGAAVAATGLTLHLAGPVCARPADRGIALWLPW